MVILVVAYLLSHLAKHLRNLDLNLEAVHFYDVACRQLTTWVSSDESARAERLATVSVVCFRVISIIISYIIYMANEEISLV